jgi:hypothetical protein
MKNSDEFVCSICAESQSGQSNWFLLVEDKWLDRLKILHWNETLAVQPGVQCACSAAHAQGLVAHWMATGSLEYPFARSSPTDKRPPPKSHRKRGAERTVCSVPAGQLIGELAVDRKSLERVLVENPASLSSILEALLSALRGEPVVAEGRLQAEELMLV